MKYKIKLILICIFICNFHIIFSQNVTISAGGNTNNSSGSVSFTIGQTYYNPSSNSLISINEGVQQPYEFYYISSIFANTVVKFKIYPNPVFYNLIVDLNQFLDEKFNYEIMAINGAILNTGTVESTLASISVFELIPGEYILHIFQNTTKDIKYHNFYRFQKY